MITMAVGQGGRAVGSRGNAGRPSGAAPMIGKHIHKGSPQSTVGGPGCTQAPGASQQGSSGSSPYGSGGDGR